MGPQPRESSVTNSRDHHHRTVQVRILRRAGWAVLWGALLWGCDPEVIVRYIDPPITVEPRLVFDPDHDPSDVSPAAT